MVARRCVKSMLAVVAVGALGVGLFAGCQSQPTPTPTPIVYNMHNSRPIAERFLQSSPTFVFDGIPFSIDLKTIDRQRDICDTCFVFHFEFKTAHPGYGDRGGQILAEVITTHTAKITTHDGRVVAGTIDDKWDILAQRFLPGTGP